MFSISVASFILLPAAHTPERKEEKIAPTALGLLASVLQFTTRGSVHPTADAGIRVVRLVVLFFKADRLTRESPAAGTQESRWSHPTASLLIYRDINIRRRACNII